MDDWLPEACKARGCRAEQQYDVERLAHGVAHWHPDETTMAGVYLEDVVSERAQPRLRATAAELARVAHLPEEPAEVPKYGVRWYRQKTLAEIMEG